MLNDKNKIVELIGYDCGWGCGDYGCEDGPAAADIVGILKAISASGLQAEDNGSFGLKSTGSHAELNTKDKTLPLLMQGLSKLSEAAYKSTQNGNIPFVIGGDHSSAIGTWSGVISALEAHQKFGMIWMDAHLDAHTYETSYQGKWGGWWHGQPVAALTGNGLSEFTKLCDSKTKISPDNFSIIGPHSFEPAEKEYVKNNNIRVFYLEEVERRGFKAVFDEALERATDGTKGFGLSIDLDGFHGDEAPGVGTAEGLGMRQAEVLPVIKSIGRNPHFKALEIVEFNPHKDINHKTRELMVKLADSIFHL